MREVGAFEAKSKLGTLLDWVEGGEEVLITRRGKAVARLVPAAIGFDRARAAEAAQRIRERAGKLQGSFSWAEWKALRDEGRP
jgi:prevent-host-death family protein